MSKSNIAPKKGKPDILDLLRAANGQRVRFNKEQTQDNGNKTGGEENVVQKECPEVTDMKDLETELTSSQEDLPFPKKKTEFEKYLKSKEREKQIKQYKESMIKETRERRARARATLRVRDDQSEDELPATEVSSSPSKKVRFSI
ncbi:hypothetical protein WICMUC_001000 [Wickerhamomyces mucosus]|uniref:Uncharacterized protein n=1 Tax=Wickerhamomyces mucosus TaxID=1378264 RepID=A0A9P8PXN3_9ASCO|nr:hypothetical protein WICMUC_001000 [Wickerhamomyces mucosus]